MKPAALIFDLDGTLLDTLQDLAIAVNTVLKANGFPAHPIDAFRYFVGRGVNYMLEQALPEDQRDAEKINKYVAEFSAYYAEHWADYTRPYTGVPELLKKLSAQGLPLAVLSNKPHDFTVQCVKQLLGDIPFAFVWGHQKMYPRKPEPDSALALADLLHSDPKDIMFVGDTSIDMQTATRAGMYAAGVAWGFRTVDELKANGARHIFYKPDDIQDYLERKH